MVSHVHSSVGNPACKLQLIDLYFDARVACHVIRPHDCDDDDDGSSFAQAIGAGDFTW